MDYDRIRQQYLLKNKSQREIAKDLGISRNTVAKYCKRGTYPGLRVSYKRANSVITKAGNFLYYLLSGGGRSRPQ